MSVIVLGSRSGEVLDTKPDHLRLTPETHGGRKELTPVSCPLFTRVLWHVNAHTQKIKSNQNKKMVAMQMGYKNMINLIIRYMKTP